MAIKHTDFVRTVVHKLSNNPGDELKTLAAQKLTWSQFKIDGPPQMLGPKVQNLVAQDLCSPVL